MVFLQEELNARFGDGAVRVICPITDPFVRHHGALGSFVRVYMRKATDLAALMAASRALPGVEEVLDGPAAARRFELPLDLEGDFVVLGDANTVIGSARAEHDLSGLAGHRLRSHGGLGEQKVPFMVSHTLRPDWVAGPRRPPLAQLRHLRCRAERRRRLTLCALSLSPFFTGRGNSAALGLEPVAILQLPAYAAICAAWRARSS